MSGTDHLAKARDYIAEAIEHDRKSADHASEAAVRWAAAGRELAVWLAEDESRTQADAARHLGTNRMVVTRALQAHREGKVDWASGSNKRDDVARTVMSDPERRRQVIESLGSQEVEGLVEQATEVAVERARAKRAEHNTEPTAKDLMGGDRFDPAEFWADTLIIRVNRNARELAHLIKRGGGLLFGTMPPGEAFEYLNEAERLIADARAAAQELARDQQVEV